MTANSASKRPTLLRAVCLVASIIAFASSAPRLSAQTSDEAAVRRTAKVLLQAISARDTATLRELMYPGTPTVSVRMVGDSTVKRWQTRDEMLRAVAEADVEFLERMWDPEVRVSGDIATVWTPYDFYIDRRFSHCGIDAFQLMRDGDRWKVVSIFYTVVRPQDRCEPSPLGPPRW